MMKNHEGRKKNGLEHEDEKFEKLFIKSKKSNLFQFIRVKCSQLLPALLRDVFQDFVSIHSCLSFVSLYPGIYCL